MKALVQWLPLAVALLLVLFSSADGDACAEDLDIGPGVVLSANCSTDELVLSYTAIQPSGYLHGVITIEYHCNNASKQILDKELVYSSGTKLLNSTVFEDGDNCTFSGCYNVLIQPESRFSSPIDMTFAIAPHNCIIGEHDECANGMHNCSSDATCVDTKEGYICSCSSGFEGDGFTCLNIIECARDDLNNCHDHASCQDTAGSYDCVCEPGYAGDGLNCTNVDECAEGSHSCDSNAQCTDLEGNYTCVCNHGYTGDGFMCTNTVECDLDLHSCHEHATCRDTVGSYFCVCDSGYSGDGLTCTNVDECAYNSHNCDMNAECVDTEGSYRCVCAQGYTGDGLDCTEASFDWMIVAGASGALVLVAVIAAGVLLFLCYMKRRSARPKVTQMYHHFLLSWNKQQVDKEFFPVDPEKPPWPSMWSIKSTDFTRLQFGSSTLLSSPDVSLTVQHSGPTSVGEDKNSSLSSRVGCDPQALSPTSVTVSSDSSFPLDQHIPLTRELTAEIEPKSVSLDTCEQSTGQTNKDSIPMHSGSTRNESDPMQISSTTKCPLQHLILDDCAYSDGYVLTSIESSSCSLQDSSNLPSSCFTTKRNSTLVSSAIIAHERDNTT